MQEHTNAILCQLKDTGFIDYLEAYSLQKQVVSEVIKGGANTLLLCEHPAVLTLGRLASEENILLSREKIQKKGIKIVCVDRGGDVTLHCPGQLVVYPIFNLTYFGKNLKLFLHKLEQVAIDLLRDFDILAERTPGDRGVWVGKEKIVSIGIGVKKWISFHGLAININTDLDFFSMINPCGRNVRMTSICEIKKAKIAFDGVKKKLVQCFCEHFHLSLIDGNMA